MSEAPPTPQSASYREGEHPAALGGEQKAEDVETVVGSRFDSAKIAALEKTTKQAEALLEVHQRLLSEGDIPKDDLGKLDFQTFVVLRELNDLLGEM